MHYKNLPPPFFGRFEGGVPPINIFKSYSPITIKKNWDNLIYFVVQKNFWWSVEYSTTEEYSSKLQLSVKIAIFEQKLFDVPKNRFFQSTRYRYPDPTTEKETSN